ncbi:MAG: hypothetical protein ACOZQL_42500 [Myxococcota bacterium]
MLPRMFAVALASLFVLAAPAPQVVARFACDDKYASADCDERAWLERALADPHGGHDVLLHDDGGPDGAVWNGTAPLYVFVSGSTAALSFGSMRALKTKGRGDWRWLRLEAKAWRSALAPVHGRAWRRATLAAGRVVLGEFWFAEGE